MAKYPRIRHPEWNRTCQVCGTKLPVTVRADTAYCSGRCRQRAYRYRKGAKS